MSPENEFQRIKREQEIALHAARDAQQRAQAHRSLLHPAALSQQQALVAQWSPIVSPLLDGIGESTWGKDGYTLITPDGRVSLSWFVVHVKGNIAMNYEVNLQAKAANLEDLTLTPNDVLVRPSGFRVVGAQEHHASLSQESLKEALVKADESGPRKSGLNRTVQAMLSQSPYKKGEHELTNQWILVPLILTFLVGLIALGAAFILFFDGVSEPINNDLIIAAGVTTLLAIGVMIVSSIALWISSFGKRFQRLSWIEKVVVVVAEIPGFVSAIVMSAGLVAVVIAIMFFTGFLSAEHEKQRTNEVLEKIRRDY